MNERLYRLLPLVYREQDFEHQQAFRALMAVLETVQDKVDEDMTLLYQNWFIETCEVDLIPYIADLVNLPQLEQDNVPVLATQRRYVANYLAYQRRSGIAATLNNSVHDASGYACYSVNSLEKMLSSWTDNDPKLVTKTVSVTGQTKGEASCPFSAAARLPRFTCNTNALASATGGELHPQVLQLYLWRMTPVAIKDAQLTPAEHHRQGWYLGANKERWPLCHQPGDLANVDVAPSAQQYPYSLTRDSMNDTLLASSHDGGANKGGLIDVPSVVFFEYDTSSHQFKVIEGADIAITDLSQWQVTDALQARVLFDPGRGRVWIVDASINGKVAVSYSYLHNTLFGAAPRYRGANELITPTKRVIGLYPCDTCLSDVLRDCYPSLQCDTQTNVQPAVPLMSEPIQVSLASNAHYGLTVPLKIDLKGSDVTLVAEDYVCPMISGTIVVSNTGAGSAQLILNGLRVYGQIHIGENVDIVLKDSSVLADMSSMSTSLPHGDTVATCLTNVRVEHSLIVTQKLMENAHYQLNGSAVICRTPSTIRAFNCVKSTVIGDITCFMTHCVSDSLINGKFELINPNMTELCYSYFSELVFPHGTQTEQIITDADVGRQAVQFSSKRYYDAGFLALAYGTEPQLLTGAANGEEMGVFNDGLARQKEKNIKNQFDKFLPLGMEVQTYYMD